MADDGAMIALGQLRDLVEKSQREQEAEVEFIEESPEIPPGQQDMETDYEPSLNPQPGTEDPDMDEGELDELRKDVDMVDQEVGRSELDELAAQMSRPRQIKTVPTTVTSETMADMDEVLESELKRLKPTVPRLLTLPWRS